MLLARPELEYKGVKDYNQIAGWGCVGGLRKRGFVVPDSPTDTAAGLSQLPEFSTDLPPEGEYVVIVTNESWAGHVALATRIGDLIIVRMEFNYGKGINRGRIVHIDNYLGHIPTLKGGEIT